MFKYVEPSEWAVLLAIGLAVSALVLFLLWRVFRAICRHFGIAARVQNTILATLGLVLCCILVVRILFPLDDLEIACKNEIIKSNRLAVTGDLEIETHRNFWPIAWSSFGGSVGVVGKPYTLPEVHMKIAFNRGSRKHKGKVVCRFSKIPESGNPPQLQFRELRFTHGVMLDDRNNWVGWQPPATP